MTTKTMMMTGREALQIEALGEHIYCACGICLTELIEAGTVAASTFDPAEAMPHFNHRVATEHDLEHVCTWTRGECDDCDELLPLDRDHDHAR